MGAPITTEKYGTRLMPSQTTFINDLYDRATCKPDVAAIFVDGRYCLTFQSWERRSNAAARGLNALGVMPGQSVLLIFDRQRWIDYMIAYAAVRKAGATPILLPIPWSNREVSRVATDANVTLVITPSDLSPPSYSGPLVHPKALEANHDTEHFHIASPTSAPADIRYISSPLAGPRKIVCSPDALLSQPLIGILQESKQLNTHFLHTFAPATESGQDVMFLSLLGLETPCSISEPLRDANVLLEALSSEDVASCGVTAPFAQILAEPRSSNFDLSHVRRVILSASLASPPLLRRLARRFPEAEIFQLNPFCEAANVVLTYDRERPGSIGRLRDRAEVRFGASRSANGTGGYEQISCKRRDGYVTSNAPTWVATTHFGYCRSSNHVYVPGEYGQISAKGDSAVSTYDILVLLREHPLVRDAAVLMIPPLSDDGRKMGYGMVAAVVLLPGVSAPQVGRFIADRLESAQLLTRIESVSEIPRTTRGRIDEKELWRMLDVGPLEDGRRQRVTRLEQEIVAIWREILPERHISPGSDFFQIGGDGLKARRMLQLVEGASNTILPMASILAARTPSGLAGWIKHCAATQGASAGAASSSVLSWQEIMLWREQLAPGSCNLPPFVQRYKGELDVRALERAVDDLTRRHESLRTTFDLREGRVLQISSPSRVPVQFRDLSHLPRSRHAEVVSSAAREAALRPYDLVSGPLFEVALLRLALDDHVLIVRVHHSVVDAHSGAVFADELTTSYSECVSQVRADLKPVGLQFRDFVVARGRYLASTRGIRDMGRWRQDMAVAPLAVQLPLQDRMLPRGSHQPAAGRVSVAIPQETADRLREIATSNGTTVFTLMLAAFQIAVHEWSGQQEVVVPMNVANRPPEFQKTIGCFATSVPLRLRLTGDPSFVDLLGEVGSIVLRALALQKGADEGIIQDIMERDAGLHGLRTSWMVAFQALPRRGTNSRALAGTSLVPVPGAAAARGIDHGRGWLLEQDEWQDETPWGMGLYLNTFMIFSVLESMTGYALRVGGLFDRAAGDAFLKFVSAMLGEIASDPALRVSALASSGFTSVADWLSSVSCESTCDLAGYGEGWVPVRGFRVMPARIEAALARCEGVADAEVVATRDVEGREELVAYVVPEAGARLPNLLQLRTCLWKTLPGYAWPRHIGFVTSLPMLVKDKGQYVATTGLPEFEARPDSLPGPIAVFLRRSWADSLGVDSIDPYSSYFNDVSFLNVLSAARQAGLSFSSLQVLRNRTVEALEVDILQSSSYENP